MRHEGSGSVAHGREYRIEKSCGKTISRACRRSLCGFGTGLLVLSVNASPSAPESFGPLIRCPDWIDPEGIFRISSSQEDDLNSSVLTEIANKADLPGASGIDDRGQLKGNAGGRSARANGKKANECARHKIIRGDTLGKIADRYLGSPSKFLEIAAANPDAAANPRRLKPGTVLTIPCRIPTAGNQDSDNPADKKDPGNGSKSGLFSWLFGKNQEAPAKAPATSPATPPASAEVPVWRASQGDFLIDVLESWGRKAGYQVVIEDRGDWQFDVEFSFEGTFLVALKEVAKGFRSGDHAPLLVVYANKVIRVGTAR